MNCANDPGSAGSRRASLEVVQRILIEDAMHDQSVKHVR